MSQVTKGIATVRQDKISSMNCIPSKELDTNSPSKVINRRRKLHHVQSMIDFDKSKDYYVKNLVVDKNLIDISPYPPLSKDIMSSYYFNRNFTDAYSKQQQQNSIRHSHEVLLLNDQKRSSMLNNGVPNHSLLLKNSQLAQNGAKNKPISTQQSMKNIATDLTFIPTKTEESYIQGTNNSIARTSSIFLNNDYDLFNGRGSFKNISPEREKRIVRSDTKKTSLQLPQIVSPFQRKEMTYLSNSSKHRAKTLEKTEINKVNPFLPNLPSSAVSRDNLSIVVGSRRSSGKEDGQSDIAINSQQSFDLFNIILNSSKNISLPGSIGNSAQSTSKLSQLKNIFHQSQQIQAKSTQNNIHEETTSNMDSNVISNSPLSAFSEKSKLLYDKSMVNNYSNSQLRDNILNILRDTLIKAIKTNPDLNEASYYFQSSQTKKEGQNQEAKVLGYQSRKDQLQEQYVSSKGNDRLYSFADYLSRFSGYIMDLIFGDIPKISTRGQRFEIQLTEQVMDKALPIISDKLKEFGMKDIISRFELVFRNEYQSILMNAPIIEAAQIDEAAESITQDLLARLQKNYLINFSQYSSTCKDFVKDILSDGFNKDKIKDYMQFIRMHLKRSSIFDSSAPSPQSKKSIDAKSSTFSMKVASTYEQHKGISESGNYKELLSVTTQDLLFVKKTFYDVIKRQVPSLSLTSRAKILEKIECLRFGYLKEVYSIDDKTNQQLVETMKLYVENSPPLLAYLKRPDSGKQITKLLTYLLDSILGESSLSLFIERSSSLLTQDLDLPLISMLEQGVKGSLAQHQINMSLQKEIEYKFIHLKRRARLTPPFNAVFYQIEQIVKYMNSWIDLMAQQKQIKLEDNEEILQQLKQIDFLEYFLVCSLSDYDTFSFSDLQVGLNFFKIKKHIFKFWLKGVKRIFAKLRLKQKEINSIDEYFQKAFSSAC